MIREHLFKGKTIKEGKWIEGSLIVDTRGNHYIGEYIPSNKDINIVSGRTQGKTLNQFAGIGFAMVDKDTVCEYTGKQDKNETKIFEGDIVAFYFFDKGTKNTRTMLIEWIDSGFCMKELFRDYRLTSDFNIVTEKIYTYKGEIKQGIYKSNNSYFVEVIGNIFDNKELLNG